MTETFSKKDDGKKSVVLIEYPRKGVWAVGFATKENKGEMADKTGKNLVQLLDTLSKDHEVCVAENVADLIESELDIKGEITKFIK